jgi:hypothetical protein
MYYLAKGTQAAGLTIIAIDFVRTFPDLMSRKILASGVILFILGWVIQRYLIQQ